MNEGTMQRDSSKSELVSKSYIAGIKDMEVKGEEVVRKYNSSWGEITVYEMVRYNHERDVKKLVLNDGGQVVREREKFYGMPVIPTPMLGQKDVDEIQKSKLELGLVPGGQNDE